MVRINTHRNGHPVTERQCLGISHCHTFPKVSARTKGFTESSRKQQCGDELLFMVNQSHPTMGCRVSGLLVPQSSEGSQGHPPGPIAVLKSPPSSVGLIPVYRVSCQLQGSVAAEVSHCHVQGLETVSQAHHHLSFVLIFRISKLSPLNLGLK